MHKAVKLQIWSASGVPEGLLMKLPAHIFLCDLHRLHHGTPLSTVLLGVLSIYKYVDIHVNATQNVLNKHLPLRQ